MAVQNILEQIREAGNAQVQEIERNAKTRVSEILAMAHSEAEEIESEARTRASTPANAERARIIHRAKSDALRLLGEVREDLVDAVIARTSERLASFRSDSSYPKVLRALTEQALAQLAASESAQDSQLQADPRDKDLLQKILAELRLNVPVRYELINWGGLIAKSQDERVVVINTLEARLERSLGYLRPQVAAYFEEEKESVVE
ncbi:MAG: V-type ATP synthase subunit E [Chloroflexota bacterium]